MQVEKSTVAERVKFAKEFRTHREEAMRTLGQRYGKEDWFEKLWAPAWIALSMGVYDDEVLGISDAELRLWAAQVRLLEIAWENLVSRLAIARTGLVFELGTGYGNSAVWLGCMLPNARIISLTVSRAHYEIAGAVVARFGLKNVELRCGDIFDTSVTGDLVGQVDGIGMIEVGGQWSIDRKKQCLKQLASLLKPGGELVVMDVVMPDSMHSWREQLFDRWLGWHLWKASDQVAAFEGAGLSQTTIHDCELSAQKTLADTILVLRRRRAEVKQLVGGWLGWFGVELLGGAARMMMVGSYQKITGWKQTV